jgi:proteasome lid subunit RPN8/RPN11
VGQTALRQIADHSISNLSTELGGALLGQAYRHQGKLFVEVSAALPAQNQDHGPIHFTFTADSWAQFQRDRTAHYPDLDIVGWFHTHPGLGVFYSSDDVVVHSAAFTLPWHVGLVVDPVRHEACFFGWVDGILAPMPGFYELMDQQRESVIDWHVVRTSVWQHAYGEEELPPPQPTPGRVYMPARGPVLSSVRPQLGWLLGALGLLLGFFLLVGWVIPLNREVNRLESVVLTLADEALADSNAAICPDPNLRLLVPLTGSQVPVGTSVDVVGTARHPQAVRYRVEGRPLAAENWMLVNAQRGHTSLGQMATWDTTDYAPGTYELRLTAVDRNNIRLANTELCLITLELTP